MAVGRPYGRRVPPGGGYGRAERIRHRKGGVGGGP